MLNKFFLRTLYALVIAELLSLWSFLVPAGMPVVFVLLCIIFLYLTLKKLDYGLYIIFAELVIGSFGYLFWFDYGVPKISIRIAFWLIFMAVWLVRYLQAAYSEFALEGLKAYALGLKEKSKNGFLPIFLLLLAIILFGAINGWLHGNNQKDIFFDFNGWLYFLLFFPMFGIFGSRNGTNGSAESLDSALKVILAALFWLSLKTLAILFIFSHNLPISSEIYHWVRDSRVGEITQMQAGFFRVFFQSHIYVLPAFFVVFFLLIKDKSLTLGRLFKNRESRTTFLFLALMCSVLFLGVSRSNWVGFSFGLLSAFAFLVFRRKIDLKAIVRSLALLALSGIFGFILMTVVVNLPFFGKGSGLNTLSLITDRASEVTEEAGASSRWSLLPVIFKEIRKYPILGKGFGSTVTYISNDPRVRENNPTGEYKTFAFEWGWLDIWYKLGLIGLAAYLACIGFVLRRIYLKTLKQPLSDLESGQVLLFGFGVGLVAIAATSIFSPYMNHPLGISFFLFVSVLSL